jgi:flagellar biosynthesis protein FlhF
MPTRTDVRAVRDELIAGGVEERRLDSLLDGFSRSTLPFLGPGACTRSAVRDYLAARMPVVRDWRPWRTGHTIALVGQSGVGKTATAVKIAGRHRAAGMDVALIATGPGPHGSLLEWARRLDLTVVEATEAQAVSHACAHLASRDLLIIDTPGCSHTAGDEVRETATLVDAAGAEEVHLVLPAATPSGDLGDLQTAFKPLGVNRVTLTKLDETRFFGGVLNAPMRIGRPLAYIADGAALPGAIAPADPRLVAELLLP